jgi:serine/threonine-protein kinase
MKVLLQNRASDDVSRDRFIWEARVQAQLEHPVIVPVYDMGVTASGAEYFTMRRIGGRTLATVLARLRNDDTEAIREFPRGKLLGAFRQVCLAVEYAHRRGVIHRDLKPENVMLGELGEVYVLDWGLAKSRASGASDTGSVEAGRKSQNANLQSQHGGIFGTPGYMAPEQVMGAREVDERADVFALGAILFEILTLEHFHPGDRAADLLQATLDGVDVEARTRDLDVAPELVRLCGSATRLSAVERLSSAQALADGVQLFLDGDRDVAARLQLAREHVGEARAARARGNSEQDRQVAMRAAGRALALDPTATEAADIVSHLLLAPPVDVPAEVERRLDAIDLDTGRSQARLGSVMMTSYLWFIPLLWWTGIRDGTLVIALAAVSLLASAQVHWMSRRNDFPYGAIYMSSVIIAVLIALVARIAGPFLIAPTLVLTNLMAYAVHPRFGRMPTIAAILTAGVAVPWFLEVVGVLEPTYRFEGGALVIASPAIMFSSAPMQLGFAVLLVLNSGITAVLLRSMASKQREITKQIELQAWQLRNIVPTGEVPSSGVTAPMAATAHR